MIVDFFFTFNLEHSLLGKLNSWDITITGTVNSLSWLKPDQSKE